MRAKKNYLLLLLLSILCPSFGQVTKRQLKEEDYKLWSTLDVEELSDSGNWVSYNLLYDSGQDTLFIKHTKSLKTYSFARGSNGKFVSEKLFICQGTDENLILKSLYNGKEEIIKAVVSYSVSADGQFLFAKKKQADGLYALLVRNLEKGETETVPNVTGYSYNEKVPALVCDSGPTVVLLELGTTMIKTTVAHGSVYSDFAWQNNGTSLAYFKHGAVTALEHYQLKERKLSEFNPSLCANFPKGATLSAVMSPIKIADDGSCIFFGLEPNYLPKDNGGVQLWNTADKMLYPFKHVLDGWKALAKVGVWFPERNSYSDLTNTKFPKVMLTADQKNALVFDPIANEPQFEQSAPIDFYLKNIATGEQHLLLTRQSPDEGKLSVSSTGRYVLYFKEKDWWLYDIATEEHRNLTEGLGTSFERANFDWSGEVDACGFAGWTDDDTAVLVYDQNDVWLLKVDGSGYVKLTNGRAENLFYRIVPTKKENAMWSNLDWTNKGFYRLAEGLVLKGKNDEKSGYFRWGINKGLSKIAFGNNHLSNIKLSMDYKTLVYTSEHYSQSPQLLVNFKVGTSSKPIFQSNTQQKNYRWGFSRLISYTNSKGVSLHGALFYPAGFDAAKSYPMVVQIYEHQSDRYNHYVNPTLLNQTGFNISNFTNSGYFVLLPDIIKQTGYPGNSAVDCVSSAVNEVLEYESVDPKRLGLLGHSFGGYQTNFIITQTNLFASAVSSAGASDVISNYLYVAWNVVRPNIFRYEFQQTNMGVSPFVDYDLYLKNSPVYYANKVQTPLLLWSGEDDLQVHYYQSMEFHMALRRLGKPNILLLYENEKHTLVGKEHQIDLTHRYRDWFDYYLKSAPKPNWFESDRL